MAGSSGGCRIDSYLDGGASLGLREGETQYGGNIGVTYRVIH